MAYKVLKKELVNVKARKAGNIRAGVLVTSEFECDSKDFKKTIKELEESGVIIKHIASEPVRHKYTVSYYDDNRNPKDIANEEWRDIPGEFYSRYQISSIGRLRSMRVLKEYERSVLTDGDGNRMTINVKKMFKQIFPEKI